MSRENVEIVRRAMDTVNRGDFNAVAADIAADAEFDFSRTMGPYAGVYRRDEAVGSLAGFADLWESLRFEALEFIDAGEQVVVSLASYLEGRDGIKVQARSTWLVTVRDRLIAGVCMYREERGSGWPGHAEALEAVGLSE